MVAATLFAIFAIADVIHDFITNDPVRYYSEQPHQLLLVAAITIVGGLLAFLFYRLSPHRQRRLKLITLGSAAGFVTVCGLYFRYQLAASLEGSVSINTVSRQMGLSWRPVPDVLTSLSSED